MGNERQYRNQKKANVDNGKRMKRGTMDVRAWRMEREHLEGEERLEREASGIRVGHYDRKRQNDTFSSFC